jgi:hypothetical protein
MTDNKDYSKNKLVVFDLDETLGYFSQLYVIWCSLIKLSKTKLSVSDFYKLSDNYIFYYQPVIFETLRQLKESKIRTIIFTNNQALYWWPRLIALYLNYKTNSDDSLFKTVIGSYKIGNRLNDKRRTSNMKKYEDLKKIMNLDDNTKILFLDDQEHPEMRHPNVEYFKVPDYVKILPPTNIVNIFLHSSFGKKFIQKNNISINFFINYIYNSLNNYELFTHSMININTNKKSCYKTLIAVKNFIKSDIETQC